MVTSNYQRIRIILKISTKSHAELSLLAQSYAALIINSLKLYIYPHILSTFFTKSFRERKRDREHH